MHWQDKSVPFEELASVPTQNTFINWQRDRTPSAATSVIGAAEITIWLPSDPLAPPEFEMRHFVKIKILVNQKLAISIDTTATAISRVAVQPKKRWR